MLCMKMVDGEVIIYEDPSMDAVWERMKAESLAEGYDLDNIEVLNELLQAAFDDDDEIEDLLYDGGFDVDDKEVRDEHEA